VVQRKNSTHHHLHWCRDIMPIHFQQNASSVITRLYHWWFSVPTVSKGEAKPAAVVGLPPLQWRAMTAPQPAGGTRGPHTSPGRQQQLQPSRRRSSRRRSGNSLSSAMHDMWHSCQAYVATLLNSRGTTASALHGLLEFLATNPKLKSEHHYRIDT
jgi:hypothetical protein